MARARKMLACPFRNSMICAIVPGYSRASARFFLQVRRCWAAIAASGSRCWEPPSNISACLGPTRKYSKEVPSISRSEEHTSELQSHLNLVCRLLLEKKKIETILLHEIVKAELV